MSGVGEDSGSPFDEEVEKTIEGGETNRKKGTGQGKYVPLVFESTLLVSCAFTSIQIQIALLKNVANCGWSKIHKGTDLENPHGAFCNGVGLLFAQGWMTVSNVFGFEEWKVATLIYWTCTFKKMAAL